MIHIRDFLVSEFVHSNTCVIVVPVSEQPMTICPLLGLVCIIRPGCKFFYLGTIDVDDYLVHCSVRNQMEPINDRVKSILEVVAVTDVH